jgi:hypothetical protein
VHRGDLDAKVLDEENNERTVGTAVGVVGRTAPDAPGAEHGGGGGERVDDALIGAGERGPD